MCDLVDGKLELLFAHLSINNVQHIQPLLYEAIDEYQAIRRSLSYEEKRNLNFVKTLLWYAERGEWAQARHRLHDAQAAYQEYISKKAAIMKKPFGYSQIHGKHRQGPYSTADINLHEHMLKSQHVEESIKSLKGTTPVLAIEDTKHGTNKQSSHSKQNSHVSSTRCSSSITDEQGPTERRRQRNHTDQDDQYTHYSKSKAVEPLSSERTPKLNDDKMKEDRYRPTMIGDAFWRLYKNEWRQALEAIKGTGMKEERAINCLYFIIQEAYQFCLLEAQSQVLEFENAAINILTEGRYSQEQRSNLRATGNIRHMVQYRNEVADVAITRLQEIFLTRILQQINRKFSVRTNNIIDNYSRMCVSVTWPMAVQDPPFEIVFETKKDFDSSIYDPYTSGGNKVAYFVWPALRLYKNGPLLCRGVAQGKSTSSQ